MSYNTQAYLTLNSFEAEGDGGGPSECDGKYHKYMLWHYPLVVTYNGGSICLNNIRINGDGRSVVAMVVDECDSTEGCDAYQPPSPNNIDASKAAWKAFGISEDNWGGLDITWSDA
ncbi:putative rlpA-like protein, double-psi beta-barrel [Rosa chinensis]|uniref:Putative rlpA-like protein, double-psi beta-barrel n=1 Tax=Rosa chinensis TaxID=74649 RepID=A0A2P6PG53_ROSCH|nr:putative rlpA-like protein, double-psi beta-barrel [Rosa chinensis]